MTSIALDLIVSCGDKLFDSVCIRNCSTVRVPLENPEDSFANVLRNSKISKSLARSNSNDV